MYSITIPDSAFVVGMPFYGVPKHKPVIMFGTISNGVTYANEQLTADGHSRAVAIRADGTCTLQDEEFEGLDTIDRVVLANLVHKGLAVVTLNGGAPITGYNIAHTTRF
jgi:hypothetical protein